MYKNNLIELAKLFGVPSKKVKKAKYSMVKILLADNGNGRGLFFSPDNGQKFIVANIEDNNGIGNVVNAWHWGKYFDTLEEAFAEYSKA